MRTLPAFTSAPLHAITVFFLLAKTVSRFFPFGGSHSVNTNTGTVTVVCWSVASFSAVGCQTNLTGVPSQGQCWERIKTVKMATVTGSWHSLYLGMMSTFDIVWPCPEIIIPQLNSTARHRSPLVMIISHKPPSFPSTPDFHLCFSSSLPGYSSVHSSFFPFSRSLRHTVHPAIFQLLHLLPLFSVSQTQQSALFALLGWIRPLQLQPQFIYFSLTFSSSVPVYMSALSHFLSTYSINRFCIPSPVALLFYSPTSLLFLLHACPRSSFHSLSGVRRSQGVNSSFIRSLWNLWCWKDELDWRLVHSA